MPVRTSTKTVLSVSVSRGSGSIALWSERETDGHSERHRPLYFQALIRLRNILSATALLVAAALSPSACSRALPGNDTPGRLDSPESQMLSLTNQDRTAQQNWEETQGRANPPAGGRQAGRSSQSALGRHGPSRISISRRIGRKRSLAACFLYGHSVAFYRRKRGQGS